MHLSDHLKNQQTLVTNDDGFFEFYCSKSPNICSNFVLLVANPLFSVERGVYELAFADQVRQAGRAAVQRHREGVHGAGSAAWPHEVVSRLARLAHRGFLPGALAELATVVPADVLGELEDNDEDLCDEDELDGADDVDELAAAVAGVAVA